MTTFFKENCLLKIYCASIYKKKKKQQQDYNEENQIFKCPGIFL